VFYKALPYENDKNHGFLTPVNLFIAFKFNEASSSDCPPDKNTTPTKAGGTVLDKQVAVLAAISSGLVVPFAGCYDPGKTIFGFNKHPSKKTF